MVGKTTLTGKLMHLEPKNAEMLARLARISCRTQSSLMREAIDDLLLKYGADIERFSREVEL